MAVAERVAETMDAAVMPLTGVDNLLESIRGARFVAVALWRLYDAECDLLDQACFEAGVPWTCTYLSGKYLYCGPVMAPGHGPCYKCFRKRFLTHLPEPERELSLMQAYNRDHALGVPGFLPGLVGMAAAFILSSAKDPAAAAGRLVQVDALSGALVDTRVVPVHGCPRCERSTDIGPQRFIQRLVPEMRRLRHAN